MAELIGSATLSKLSLSIVFVLEMNFAFSDIDYSAKMADIWKYSPPNSGRILYKAFSFLSC